MTTEQREAIEYLKESVLIYKNTIPKISQLINTVLSLIKQLEREKEIHVKLEQQYKKEYLDMSELNQKLKKQIDLYTEELICNEFDRCCQECCRECEKDKDTLRNCIKQYFENKVSSFE